MSDAVPPVRPGPAESASPPVSRESDSPPESASPPESTSPPAAHESGLAPAARESGPPPVPPESGPPPASPESAAAERYPFWNYGDLLLFVGLVLPSILVGALLVKAAAWLLHLNPAAKVAEVLSVQFLIYAILFGALRLIFRVKYDRPLWRSLGWTPIPIPFALVASSGVLAGFLVALASSLIHTPDTSNPLMDLLQGRTSVILVALFGITLGPVCEELGFRGFLQPLLVRSLGAAPGIVLAAVPFGLLHYQEYGNSWRHALLITLAGVAFGAMRHRTGSTKAAALMHAAYNSLFFLVLFAQKKDLSPGW